MRFLALVFVNLRRHKLRALIGVAGIGFGVAAMLTILSIVNGAIGMFERILAVDSHYLVFEKNVSRLGVDLSPVDAIVLSHGQLSGQYQLVVTRDGNWRAEGVIVAQDLPSAFALAYEDAHRTGADEIAVQTLRHQIDRRRRTGRRPGPR